MSSDPDPELPTEPRRQHPIFDALHYGSEAEITPGLVATRRLYADAYRRARQEAVRLSGEWLDAARVLPGQHLCLVRQLAHAIASTAVLESAVPSLRKGASTMHATTDGVQIEDAGAVLRALGEDVVLLAFYRGGADFPKDRYSVRLVLDGVPNGIQESAATASAALAKARASRDRHQRRLQEEAELRAEIAARTKSMRR